MKVSFFVGYCTTCHKVNQTTTFISIPRSINMASTHYLTAIFTRRRVSIWCDSLTLPTLTSTGTILYFHLLSPRATRVILCISNSAIEGLPVVSPKFIHCPFLIGEVQVLVIWTKCQAPLIKETDVKLLLLRCKSMQLLAANDSRQYSKQVKLT